MKQTSIFLGQKLDERQLAILVRLCLTACREALDGSRSTDGLWNNGGKSGGDEISLRAVVTDPVGIPFSAPEIPNHQAQESRSRDQTGAHSQSQSQQSPPKVLLSIEEAAQMLGIGRSLMYELVRRQEIASITIGRVRRIPVIELEAFVHRRLEAAAERSVSASVSDQVFRLKPATKGDEAA